MQSASRRIALCCWMHRPAGPLPGGSRSRWLHHLQLQLQPPADLVTAAPAELLRLLPHSYEICCLRNRSFESRGMVVRYTKQGEALPRCRPPSDSYLELTYPFTSNTLLGQQYVRFGGPALRLGLLLEDADSFAADVAARHAGGLRGRTVMTAAMEALDLYHQGAVGPAGMAGGGAGVVEGGEREPAGWGTGWGGGGEGLFLPPELFPLSVERDLRMAGQATWVGRSSCEVLVELSVRLTAQELEALQQQEQQQQQQPQLGDGGAAASTLPPPPATGLSSQPHTSSSGFPAQSSVPSQRPRSTPAEGPTAAAAAAAAAIQQPYGGGGGGVWVSAGLARFVLVVREPPGGNPALRLTLPTLLPGAGREQQRYQEGEARHAIRSAARGPPGNQQPTQQQQQHHQPPPPQQTPQQQHFHPHPPFQPQTQQQQQPQQQLSPVDPPGGSQELLGLLQGLLAEAREGRLTHPVHTWQLLQGNSPGASSLPGQQQYSVPPIDPVTSGTVSQQNSVPQGDPVSRSTLPGQQQYTVPQVDRVSSRSTPASQQYSIPQVVVPISSTERVAVALMHSQDRNLLAHIFGGHLLRGAYELAWGSALLHAGCSCELLGCSDVTFQQPVPIGCLLEFRAKVVLTQGRLIRVSVTATKFQLQDQQQQQQQPAATTTSNSSSSWSAGTLPPAAPPALHQSVTNAFSFLFLAASPGHLVPQVVPHSLQEAGEYLEALRAQQATAGWGGAQGVGVAGSTGNSSRL